MRGQPVQDLYTQKAKLYQSFFERFLKWETVLGAFFREHRLLRPGMKLLDAGCGAGAVTKTLYRLARQEGIEGITFDGFDLTPAMLDLFGEWIQQAGTREIRLQQADALELDGRLPSDWTGYDLIISAAMLEFIPKDRLGLVLERLKRRLKDSGRLLLLVTRRTWIARLSGAKWWGTNLFDRSEPETVLDQAGFTRIQFLRLPGYWDVFLLAILASAGS